jgi:hypothetical protein
LILESSKHLAIDIYILLEKGLRNLVAGEDNELVAAYAHFHKMVDQENYAVANATLAGVEQLKSGVKMVSAVADRTVQNTETIIESMLDFYLDFLVSNGVYRRSCS